MTIDEYAEQIAEELDEMAKTIYSAGVALDGTDFAFGLIGRDDHFHRLARALFGAGYRKRREVNAKGKLVYIPLKPGDTIYVVVKNQIKQCWIQSVESLLTETGLKLSKVMVSGSDVHEKIDYSEIDRGRVYEDGKEVLQMLYAFSTEERAKEFYFKGVEK